MVNTYPLAGGMAEWLKAAVLKTVERKFRGFESYFLRHIFYFTLAGEVTELADGARLLSECGGYTPPRVRIPLSPPALLTRILRDAGFSKNPIKDYASPTP